MPRAKNQFKDRICTQRYRQETITLLSDPAKLLEWLDGTTKLSDEAYEELVHDIGWRITLWHMRAGAWRGDVNLVRACDIYLRYVEAWRAKIKRARVIGPESSAEFEQPARPSPGPQTGTETQDAGGT